MSELASVSICAFPTSEDSASGLGSRGERTCGRRRRRRHVLLLVRLCLGSRGPALLALGRFGSRCGQHIQRTIRELLSYDLALSAFDFTMCRFVKVLVLSLVRAGERSPDAHEQRPKSNTFCEAESPGVLVACEYPAGHSSLEEMNPKQS